MTGVFICHKGAESGEVDWRPTEIPEDYYAGSKSYTLRNSSQFPPRVTKRIVTMR